MLAKILYMSPYEVTVSGLKVDCLRCVKGYSTNSTGDLVRFSRALVSTKEDIS